MHTFKADSKGTPLIVHLKAVQKIAVMMAERLGVNNDIKSCVAIAALLHDIGKCYTEFQNYIQSNMISDEFEVNKLLHHEISWAILKKILSSNDNTYRILYSIYWHHSREMSGSKKCATAIIDMLNDENIQRVLDLYNHLTASNKTINDVKTDLCDDRIPDYYADKDDSYNSINMVILSCVISADRYVSNLQNQERVLNDDNFCNVLVDQITLSNKKTYSMPIHYNVDRFNYQMGCIKDIGDNQTTILKAPSGFGKTLTGLVSWIENGSKKLIWVCPRNVIAETIYKNVIDEVTVLNINANVELFLTGKVQARNYVPLSEYDNGFSAEIIITNIDNFLTPTINNCVRNRMYSIMSNYVIFDEFHELIGEEPLFACFINIMRARHRLTNSQTLLMSATPSIMNYLWDSIGKKTTILPEGNVHYKAPHDKPYIFKILTSIENIEAENNHLLIMNAISSTQKLAKLRNYSLIAHSKYMDSDRKAIIENIFNLFGKDKPDTNKVSTISAPIIQAAMNLSYLTVTESVKDPESSLQRLGRTNRFGEYATGVFNFCINIHDIDIDKREKSAIETTYSNELKILWSKHIINNINPDKRYTLDQIYRIYNTFNIENEEIIVAFIKSRYKKSLSKMSELFPRKYMIDNKRTKKISTNNENSPSGSKLRDNGLNKIYCIYPIYGTDKFTDVFNVDDDGPDVDEGDNNTQKNQLKVIKNLLNDKRFSYNKHSLYKNGNKFTSLKLKNMAKNPETPYICFHKTYHPKFGLIDNALL